MQFARHNHPPSQPGKNAGDGGGGACGAGGPDSGPAPGRLTLLLSTPPWRATPWAEALPAVLAPLGVQAVHTTSVRQAERIIRSIEVHLAVVDLSTPLEDTPEGRPIPGAPDLSHFEEAGTRILELLQRLHQAPPTVVLKSPQQSRDEHRQVQHALRCNAFAVVDRTAADLETMLNVMQRAVCRFYKDRWPINPGQQQPPSPPSNFV
jgi:hypothetical protein